MRHRATVPQRPLPKISYKHVTNVDALPKALRDYIEEKARLCQPDAIHVCDGSQEEYEGFLKLLQEAECAMPLKKMKDCYLTLTDPDDVARVESRTIICTQKQLDTIPTPKGGFKPAPSSANLRNLKVSQLGNWLAPEDFWHEVNRRFPGCMRGRTMYVIPFSMGPIGSPISKIGVELTDSAYVACSMRVMTRMGKEVIEALSGAAKAEFVKCLHSVGVPLPTERKLVNNWPCNPEMVMVGHVPENNEVISYGSGYGGNSLLGKKCFALRLGSILAKREGWLAEHMLILGITNPQGVKKYITAAFPSACGKTNLAMLTPTLPGWKVECVGDDIAWMKFDEKGVLRAINPEAGFFGVAPGTSSKTNPMAMKTIQSNTLFTNVARTTDGAVYWEGMDEQDFKLSPDAKIISWKGKEFCPGESKEPAAHPNSRFCTPASQCPIIDPQWESPEGVPISAIIFGGRRPQGIPLVYETFDWQHGVFVGAAMKSEATAAAEHKAKVIMHDPFAMRPFFGYNFGDYMAHWLSLNKPGRQMPKIFHVNWFRKSAQTGQFLWPGYCQNTRVLEWIFRRCCGEESIARDTAIGRMPTLDSINLEGLENEVSSENLNELFSLDKKFLEEEVNEIRQYIDECVNESTPSEIYTQLDQFEQRIKQMN